MQLIPNREISFGLVLFCVRVVRACLRACMRACVRVCVRACMRVCVRACVRACVRVVLFVFTSDHIALLGLILSSPVEEAHALARHVADFVLVFSCPLCVRAFHV